MDMELTQEQIREVAEMTAHKQPEVLLAALRANGHWLYSIDKESVKDYVERNKLDEHNLPPDMPITNEDMHDVNRFDNVSHHVDYDKVMNSIIFNINLNRMEKLFNQDA